VRTLLTQVVSDAHLASDFVHPVLSGAPLTNAEHVLDRELPMAIVTLRYIVTDLSLALTFYTEHLGFTVELHPAPTFAMLRRGDLRLLLSVPSTQGGGGQTLADGQRPEPGGWNRFQLEVTDLSGMVQALQRAGVRFRSERITGIGGTQALLEDPSGNLVELFEPMRRS